MADVQIKDLNEVNSLGAGDKLIVNTENTTTNIIDIQTFVDILGGGGGGDPIPGFSGFAYAPMTYDFTVNQGACQKGGAESWSVDPNYPDDVKVQYNSWESAVKATGGTWTPSGTNYGGQIKDVLVSDTYTATMPQGADVAVILYQTVVSFRPRTQLEGVKGEFRMVKSDHRVRIEGAEFILGAASTADSFGEKAQASVRLHSNSPNEYSFQGTRHPITKFDVVKFDDQKEVKFTTKMNVKKAGRANITANAGRILILPYRSTPALMSILENLVSASSLNNYNEEYDEQYTELDDALFDGEGARNYMIRLANALSARRFAPPVGGASPAEYDALIGQIFGMFDDITLDTYDNFLDKMNTEILPEATKDKYGIASALQFEINAGATKGMF